MDKTLYTNYHLICQNRPIVESQEPRARWNYIPRSNFPKSRTAFPRHNQLSLTPTKRFYGCQRTLWRNSSTTRPHTWVTMRKPNNHTFAALIRLPTTTHNLLKSNTNEILSNNSEKLILLADKHLWTFLLHSSHLSSWMYSHTVCRPA